MATKWRTTANYAFMSNFTETDASLSIFLSAQVLKSGIILADLPGRSEEHAVRHQLKVKKVIATSTSPG